MAEVIGGFDKDSLCSRSCQLPTAIATHDVAKHCGQAIEDRATLELHPDKRHAFSSSAR